MDALAASFVFVVLAEMGDKTQLLAMCMAARYPWKLVMVGIFLATVLNHLLAVGAGVWLAGMISMELVQWLAAASFVLFGLWTVYGDESGECKTSGVSPLWTVVSTFFLAEMGDKTQLATVALAASYQQLLPVWIGTTTGMMVADGLGIWIGVRMGRNIPEHLVKWFAAIVFVLFGLWGLYEYTPAKYLTPAVMGSVVAGIAAAMALLHHWGKRRLISSEERHYE